MDLDIDTITFGKYKGKTIKDMLRDRGYCKWFVDQPEFKEKYEYIFNKVKEYNPRVYFLSQVENSEGFLNSYTYFNLIPVENLKINLSEIEKRCYEFYLNTINELKKKILDRLHEENPFNIKAPTKWLQTFESETGIKREQFKEFINSYELPNITSIVEDIKKEGGIVYNGANSYNIAKKRSVEQEEFWGNILKEKYGENIGSQFKFEKCIFDFINISMNELYECKLNIKDFNEEQYDKYLVTLDKYNIVYLIDRDCVINIGKKTIFTLDLNKYLLTIAKIKQSNKFIDMITKFELVSVSKISDVV